MPNNSEIMMKDSFEGLRLLCRSLMVAASVEGFSVSGSHLFGLADVILRYLEPVNPAVHQAFIDERLTRMEKWLDEAKSKLREMEKQAEGLRPMPKHRRLQAVVSVKPKM